MRKSIKLGAIGLLSAILLSGCFDDNPEDLVKTYFNSINDGDWVSASKVLSKRQKGGSASALLFICSQGYRNIYLTKLRENNFGKIAKNGLAYYKLSSEAKDKVISICLDIIHQKDKYKKDIEIVNSKVDDDGSSASVGIEVTRPDFGTLEYTVKLKKIKDEWKITKLPIQM